MSDDEDEKTTSLGTLSRFNGEDDEWDVWSTQFLSVLGTKKLTKVLHYTDPIPKDADDLKILTGDSDPVKADKKMKQKMRTANAEAFSVLIRAFDTSKTKGKLAFYLVKTTMDESSGYKYGHFQSAWEKLLDKYESKDIPDLTAEQTKYYDRKMALDEDPEDFILEMEIKRAKLTLLGDTSIADDTKFKRDLLSKLPNSPKEGVVGPYYHLKVDYEKQLKVAPAALKVDEMRKEMKRLFLQLYPDKAVAKGSSSGGETGLTASNGGGKQFKKKCFKCGEWGHPAKLCPNKKKKFGGSNGGGGGGGGGGGSHSTGGTSKRFQGKCHHCGKIGHRKSECYQLHGKPDSGNAASTYDVVLNTMDLSHCYLCNDSNSESDRCDSYVLASDAEESVDSEDSGILVDLDLDDAMFHNFEQFGAEDDDSRIISVAGSPPGQVPAKEDDNSLVDCTFTAMDVMDELLDSKALPVTTFTELDAHGDAVQSAVVGDALSLTGNVSADSGVSSIKWERPCDCEDEWKLIPECPSKVKFITTTETVETKPTDDNPFRMLLTGDEESTIEEEECVEPTVEWETLGDVAIGDTAGTVLCQFDLDDDDASFVTASDEESFYTTSDDEESEDDCPDLMPRDNSSSEGSLPGLLARQPSDSSVEESVPSLVPRPARSYYDDSSESSDDGSYFEDVFTEETIDEDTAQDGSTTEGVLEDYQYVPELYTNLFSIMKAIEKGWKLRNDGVMMC
ncbi:unknown protein [Seminavis robusta]|uniref:CCHC-type domain-containing protein n=1 Tax=Seminavis robusta TaxID=568900 RepID=A0A9N8EVQ8_9STRA|nr:unknown protein [Seminavis robusta]|eukprot:Sro2130_g315850.1 n/a (733) ;mRNA; f:10714-13140